MGSGASDARPGMEVDGTRGGPAAPGLVDAPAPRPVAPEEGRMGAPVLRVAHPAARPVAMVGGTVAAAPAAALADRPAMVPWRDRLWRPLRALRISVTDRCTFRCTYCMPRERFGADHAFLPADSLLSREEIVRVAGLLVAEGVEKIRITGGEPLVRADLPAIVADLVALPGLRDLSVTTNGSLLAGRAAALRDAGLRRITVSLDSLDDRVFGRLNGVRAPVAGVLAGIEAALDAGLSPVKVNMLVQRGTNDGCVLPVAGWARERGVQLRLIEYMDVGTANGWRPEDVVPAAELVARIDARWPLEPMAARYLGEVATRYRYRDGAGEVGVIASVSTPFCGDCTRMRLGADGRLYTCLFAEDGFDLRRLLRGGATDAELSAAMAATWTARDDRYSERRATLVPGAGRDRRVEMFAVGG